VVVAVSDTHGSEGHRLAGRTLEAVREADLVVHAGDFTTATVLDAFEGESERFVGVYGNNDDATVCERLPAERVVEVGGLRIALVHGHAHDATALSLLGRQENVDLVVSGHSHRPAFDDSGPVALLNPGSHADPRWNRPAHAEIDVAPDGGDGSGGKESVRGRLCEPDGTVFEEFELPVTER
jgi:putative phosphoesterase